MYDNNWTRNAPDVLRSRGIASCNFRTLNNDATVVGGVMVTEVTCLIY